MVLFRNLGHGVLFFERSLDRKDFGLSRIPKTEAFPASLGVVLRYRACVSLLVGTKGADLHSFLPSL